MTSSLVYWPLTHPQRRVMNMETFYPETPINHIGGIIFVNGPLQLDKLKQAIATCIMTTESLRLKLVEKDDEMLQYVDPNADHHIPAYEFSTHKDMLEWAEKAFKTPFQLLESSLAEFAVLKVGEQQSGYFIKCHHTVADGWSMKVIIDKISQLYTALTQSSSIEQEADNHSVFIDKESKYMNSPRFKKDQQFWKETLSDVSDSYLVQGTDQIKGHRQSHYLDRQLSERIYEFIDTHHCSINSLFTLGLFVYLHKRYQQKDFIIGTPVLNRSGQKEKATSGMTVSTMPYRMKMNPHLSLLESLSDVQKSYKTYFLHQRYPYDALVKDLELAKAGYDQLFQIYINSYSTNMVQEMEGYKVEYMELYNGFQPYGLQVAVKEWDEKGQIELQYDYKISDYSNEDINFLHERMLLFVENILTQPKQLLKDVLLMTEEEEHRELYQWNDTGVLFPQKQKIHELITDMSKTSPDRIAIQDGSHIMTYGELERKTNQMAHFLHTHGLQRHDFVAICMNHSPELIVLLLGILKAGGAYVPIDPEYPQERIQFILDDSQAKLFFTDHASAYHFNGDTYNIYNVWDQLDPYDAEHTFVGDDEDVAYMIYTSGSTGQPKGVMIEHQSLVNYIMSAKKNYTDSVDDHFALYSSIAFDLTITSIYTPLVIGSTVVIYRQEDQPGFLLEHILFDQKAKVIKLTPAHMALLTDAALSQSVVKRMIVGGEQLSTSLVKRITEASDGRISIFNEYGPTEATVGCMIHQFHQDDGGTSVSIGVPMPNTEIYLLDENQQVVLPGTIGEIYISGAGVGRGYWQRPDLQKSRFLPNPFVSHRRMYRTGDIAKRASDGKIEYIGRIDHQIKLRGYRIELGEIELALMAIDEVDKAAVIDLTDESGEKQLAAYIELKDEELTSFLLRKKLSDQLPAYMVPAYFVVLKELPLTQNGKINRAALPDPLLSQVETAVEWSKETADIEGIIVDIAKAILGHEKVEPADHFYQLGGDSIKAIQFIAKLKDKGLYLKTKDLFTYPIFREMAQVVQQEPVLHISQEQAVGDVKSIPIIEWFWSQRLKDKHFWHQSIIVHSKKKMDERIVQSALKELVIHHDGLRLKVHEATNTLYYDENIQNIPLTIHDFTALSEENVGEALQEVGCQIKQRTHLYQGPLIQAALCQTASQSHLIFTAHHLLVDGMSWQILVEDLIQLFHAEKSSAEVLPPKTHSYQIFTEWVNEYAVSEDVKEAFNYWENVVQGIQPLYQVSSNEGYVKDEVKLTKALSVELTDQLTNQANKAYQTQPHELLISALTQACYQQTNQKRISLELEGHGRDAVEENIDVSRTCGWFTTMYPVNVHVSESLSDHIRAVKETIREVPNKGAEYGLLSLINRQLPDHSAPQLRFNYLGEIDQVLKQSSDYEMSYFTSGIDSSLDNPLTTVIDMVATIKGGQLIFHLSFSEKQLCETDMMQLLQEIEQQIERMVQHCLEQEGIEFTPSDFETVDMSLEEMDSLFT
ncbi:MULTISPECIES: non-ribosomal peptide synthetase [Bacillus]|uniref:non-ribosomal peptide synthetase n=1 Tax=Bacillus TaxID=1386 RepID=UPI001BE5F3D6|nr:MULTISPECIES: non-ribosomal peptide synthetase [Bacillus]MBT2261831.1 amino acid adenylation domain-containing protein [Bacillus safensis]MDH6563461.1 amino acid adenylation domain-containing protein/non-ribosomal peptide synthase protein (TIGR01720 family) [Bacillus sp. TBS-096]